MARKKPDYERLISAINAAEANSYGSDNEGDLSNERATAIDYYLGKNIEPAPDGRSQVVDRSVYETIQWIKPSLARIFANGDDVVEMPPVSQDDEKSAKQESQYLNYIVLQRNNWFQVFDTGCTDALLNKAGYLYPYQEKRRQVELERYERQTQEGVALIMQEKPDVVSLEEYPDPEYTPPPPQPVMQPDPMTGQPVPLIDPATGQPVMQPPPPPPMLYDIEIRRVREEKKFCILALPPERCKIAKTTTTTQLRDCTYFEYWDYPTLSELRADGYEIEDDIASDPEAQPEEDTARDQYGENAWANDDQSDPAMKRVRCRWIWIRHDEDEDGIAELQYVVRVGNKVLHREEINRIPIGVLCADPMPHRHVGLCPADAVIDVQRIKTVILRQGLDNLQLSNNPKTYANPAMVNLDDLLVSRPGGIVRGKGQFGIDIAPMAVPFVFPQTIEGLAYMDSVKDTRTGVNSNFTGIEKDALSTNQSGVAINQLSTMAAQRVEQIARNFANGIEETFAILHEIILKSGHQKETVRLRGEWVQIDPSTWRRRTDFKISVGYAAGNKDAMVARLQLIGQKQMEALSMGLPIVQPRNLYETNLELTKAADMSSADRFWTDPATVPPPGPPQPDVTVMAAEGLKAQSSEKVKAAELQSEERIKQAELTFSKYKADLDANTKIQIENMQVRHAESVEHFRATHSVGMKHLEGSQSAELKEREIKLKQQPAQEMGQQVQQLSSQLIEAVQSMKEALQIVLTAKRQIRRGKNGQAEGVDVVGPDGSVLASQSVQRGPDGRIAGSA
jgi:hypothetical protein